MTRLLATPRKRPPVLTVPAPTLGPIAIQAKRPRAVAVVRGTMAKPTMMYNRAATPDEVQAFHRAVKACGVDLDVFSRNKSGQLHKSAQEERDRARVYQHMQCAGVSGNGIAAACRVSRNTAMDAIKRLEGEK